MDTVNERWEASQEASDGAWTAENRDEAIQKVEALAILAQSFSANDTLTAEFSDHTCLETPDCPPTLLASDGGLLAACVEVFFGDDRCEDIGPPSILAERWLERVGGPFIPFDMAARREAARRSPPEFMAMIRRHDAGFFDD